MEAIDLTQLLNNNTPVYPGTTGPVINEATTIENDGFAEKLISMYSHTGTHMDSPSHMIRGAKSLDEFDVSKYTGDGIVIDVSKTGSKIEVDHIRSAVGARNKIEFILFKTNWDKKWGSQNYYEDFPIMTKKSADYLATLDIKGIGVDCISVDPVGDEKMTNHKVLMNSEIVIIENLRNLELLGERPFIFYCFPLKIESADGSPIRAVGIIK